MTGWTDGGDLSTLIHLLLRENYSTFGLTLKGSLFTLSEKRKKPSQQLRRHLSHFFLEVEQIDDSI